MGGSRIGSRAFCMYGKVSLNSFVVSEEREVADREHAYREAKHMYIYWVSYS
jgi:hypothetical protein